MEAAIIGVLGAGLLGLLGIFLQAMRSDIRALGTRLGRSEAILGEVRERLAGIEATQAEHGRLLSQMLGYGERIAALEGSDTAD